MIYKYISKASFAICLFLILLSSNLSAQVLNSPLPFDSSVTTGTLNNGLRYYIKPNPKPEKKVELRLAINAGSILENNNQQGLAHFMEHMNFNGTTHYPKNELVDFLQSIGVQFGADLNAYTSFDETVYILPIPTDKPDNIEKGFEVLSDWAQKALITDKDVNDERKVVLEESRLGKGADDRMMKFYLPKLMAGSHYSERLPIGKEDILKNCNPDAIRSFYKDWYRPDLMAVAVVGDITVEKAKALIEQYFSSLTNPKDERLRTTYDVPAFKKKEAMVLTDKEATNQEFSLVYSSKKTTADLTLQDYRSNLVKNLFIQVLNNRLRELTQSATPPFLYSYASIGGWARGFESFQLNAVASGDMKTTVDASIGELVKAQKFGFNNTELDIVKKGTISWIERIYNERNTTESGNIIEEYLRNFLTHEPMPGIQKDYQYYKDFLPTITLKEVNEMAKIWLDDNKTYFALSLGPENNLTKKLSNKNLLKIINNAFSQEVKEKTERVLASSLLKTEPVSGKIIFIEKDSLLDATTYTLSNGVKVTMKSTTFKSDEIIFSGQKKGGTGQFSVDDKLNAMYMSSIVGAMGFGQFNPIDLKNFLSGKNIAISTNVSLTNDLVQGSSSIKDLETMLQLNYLKLTSTRKDLELFKGFIAKQKSSLQNIKSNPQMAFFDTLNKSLYNNNPFTPISIPTEDNLNSINPERVLEIYNTEFANADGFHFFFVGNVDESTFQPLIEKHIASLPTKGTTPNYKDNGLRPRGGKSELKIYKGSEPKSIIVEEFYGELPYSEGAALKADLLADILNIKIIEELREKIGGIYSGGMYSDVNKEPYNNFSFVLYLPCGPESVDTLLHASMDEIIKLKNEGPMSKDLEKAKLAKIEAYREAMKTNAFWNKYLCEIKFNGVDKQRFLGYESILNSVTPEQIKDIANQMLSGENSFRAILYPEK